MLNISLSTGGMYSYDYIEVFDMISKTSCKYIELFMTNIPKEISLSVLVNEIEKKDLTVHSIHTPLDSFLLPDEYECYWINKCIDLAKAVDAKLITTHIVKKEENGIKINIDNEHKKNLIKFAENDIIVCTENLPIKTDESQADSFLRNYTKLKDFLDEYGVFMTFDTTHWASTNTPLIEGYDFFKDHIRNIHISDYLDGIEHLPLGTGNLQFNELLYKLHEDNYQYPITIELDLVSEDRKPLENKEEMINALNISLDFIYNSLKYDGD